MTLSPYAFAEFRHGNNPALMHEVVEAAIKLKYTENLSAKSLLNTATLPSSITSTIVEEAVRGDVQWLTEAGTLPTIQGAFSRETRSLKPYGYQFEITEEQVMDGHTDEVKTLINRGVHALRKFEDTLIFKRIMDASSINTLAAARPWDVATGSSAGDPVKDLADAVKAINEATEGFEPDTLVVSGKTYTYLCAYDFVKNTLYNTADKDGFIHTGKLPTLMGMKVMKNNNIDPLDSGKCLVLKSGDIGTWEERIPLKTKSVDGATLGKPLLDSVTYSYAKADANIKYPKLGCIITGLYT